MTSASRGTFSSTSSSLGGAWWIEGNINGGQAEQKGIEVSGAWAATERLNLSWSAFFADPEFTEDTLVPNSDEIYIAARVDGCSAAGAFVRVMLPLARPGLVATGLLVFVFAWNEFLYALTLTSSIAARTVPVGIALFPGLHEVPWGEIAAGSVAVTLPVVALALIFQRRILDGLTAGAVKG